MISALLKSYWRPLAVLLLITAAFLLAYHLAYSSGYKSSDAAWKEKWAQRDKKDAEARISFTQEQRRIELLRQATIDQIQREADEDNRKANAARAAAQRIADRLQSGIENAIDKLQQRRGGYTGTASSGTAGTSTADLLAELYREIDAAAGEYAAEADRRGRVAMTCERAYDAIRNSRLTPIINENKK